jgi:hypothetical protein
MVESKTAEDYAWAKEVSPNSAPSCSGWERSVVVAPYTELTFGVLPPSLDVTLIELTLLCSIYRPPFSMTIELP